MKNVIYKESNYPIFSQANKISQIETFPFSLTGHTLLLCSSKRQTILLVRQEKFKKKEKHVEIFGIEHASPGICTAHFPESPPYKKLS